MQRGALILLAEAAIRKGHAGARLRHRLNAIGKRLRGSRDWTARSIGPIEITAPPDWGDLEPAGDDCYVIHNRPRWARVDGDAVWYGNAVEIRFEPDDGRPDGRSTVNQAMTEERRVLALDGRTVVAKLRIARGVGPGQRRIANKVFRSIRTSPRANQVSSFERGEGADRVYDAPLLSNGEARVALDFLRHHTNKKRLEGSGTP